MTFLQQLAKYGIEPVASGPTTDNSVIYSFRNGATAEVYPSGEVIILVRDGQNLYTHDLTTDDVEYMVGMLR